MSQRITQYTLATQAFPDNRLLGVNRQDVTMAPTGTDYQFPLSVILTSGFDNTFASAQGSLLYRSGVTWVALAPGVAGQVLTSGGANANPSWTTVAGGGSGTVNSGNLGQVAFYASSGTSVTGSSMTAILDGAFGAAQGNILFRALAWQSLAPGAAGTVLTSGGPSANPSWTILVPTPKRYQSLQSLMVPTSDPTNPSGGTDVSTQLQNIANDSTAFNVIVADGGCYKGRVSLPSGRGIQGTGGRWKGPGYPAPKTGLIHPQSSGWCVRNANWTTDVLTSNGLDSGTTFEATLFSQIVDQDITIRDLWIHGNFGHAAGNSAYDPTNSLTTFFTTDPFGLLYGQTGQSNGYFLIVFGGVTIAATIEPIHMHGVRNLVMENCSFYYPPGSCFQGSYLDGAYISNLHCYNPLVLGQTFAGTLDNYSNSVGGAPLLFEGSNRGLRLYAISGGACDDAIAFNAWDGGGNATYVTTAQKAGYAAYFLNYFYGNGIMTDIVVDGMDLYAAEAVFRFVTGGNSVGGTGRAAIDGVTISNVRASGVYGAPIRLDNIGTAIGTGIGKICLTNLNIDTNIDTAYMAGAFVTGGIKISQSLLSLTLNNCIFTDNGNMASKPLFNVTTGAQIQNLILNGCLIDGYQNILNISGGTGPVRCVVNAIHSNKGAGNFSIYTTGGTPGTLTGQSVGVTIGGSTNWTNELGVSSDLQYPEALGLNSAVTDSLITPFSGLSWFSSNAAGRVITRAVDVSSNKLTTMDDGTFFKCTACNTVSNTNTATSLLSGPTVSWGTLTIPGGALKAGQKIEIDWLANLSDTSTPTLNLAVMVGNTSVVSTGAFNLGSGVTNTAIFSCGATVLDVITVGNTGSINGTGLVEGGGSGGEFFWAGGASSGSGTSIAVNTNQPNVLDFRGTFSAASPSNQIQILSFAARIRG